MLLGKNEEFWCLNLKYSCITDVQPIKGNFENIRNLSFFVWFQNIERNSDKDNLKENSMKGNYPLQEFYEFVWFEDGANESQETKKSSENTTKSSNNKLIAGQNQESNWLWGYFSNFFV